MNKIKPRVGLKIHFRSSILDFVGKIIVIENMLHIKITGGKNLGWLDPAEPTTCSQDNYYAFCKVLYEKTELENYTILKKGKEMEFTIRKST